MSIHQMGHRVICDGKFKDEAGEFQPCGAELHPNTRAVINKAGVMGHHCELCYDPEKTAATARRLNLTEEAQLRELSVAERSKLVADMDAKEAADRAVEAEKQQRQVKLANQIQALKANADGEWPVEGVKEPFSTRKEAVDFLTKKSKNGGWPPA
jgi:serine phosphatase RsbU (regulator of sigma subunit)